MSITPIAQNEYETRSSRLRQKMKDEGFDALIVFSDEYRSGHGTYLTGYKPINVIEESPQVVMYVGDNITDFPMLTQDIRKQDASAFSHFGDDYIAIPNSMYGSFDKNLD